MIQVVKKSDSGMMNLKYFTQLAWALHVYPNEREPAGLRACKIWEPESKIKSIGLALKSGLFVRLLIIKYRKTVSQDELPYLLCLSPPPPFSAPPLFWWKSSTYFSGNCRVVIKKRYIIHTNHGVFLGRLKSKIQIIIESI